MRALADLAINDLLQRVDALGRVGRVGNVHKMHAAVRSVMRLGRNFGAVHVAETATRVKVKAYLTVAIRVNYVS